jgi:mRNA-degrading endonuclease toxin of MazEF toxin-antitoxin module
VVLLTRSSALRRLSGVTVAPVTRTIRGIETEVLLELPTSRGRGAITLDNILTIQKSMLREFICSLEEPTMHDVFGAVHAAFDMPF